MTCAYDALYIPLAQRALGDAFDYAVHSLHYSLSAFYGLFIVSGIARQFEIGNPTYIAGKNGCEIARLVLERCGLTPSSSEDLMYQDKSSEYWVGWALSYYQWKSCCHFEEITRTVPVDVLLDMYPVYHEMDISHFVEMMDQKMDVSFKQSALQRLRKYAEMSQSQLAKTSDVPLRQIQLFEQKQRDIRKTQANTLANLSIALHCNMEDLLR